MHMPVPHGSGEQNHLRPTTTIKPLNLKLLPLAGFLALREAGSTSLAFNIEACGGWTSISDRSLQWRLNMIYMN